MFSGLHTDPKYGKGFLCFYLIVGVLGEGAFGRTYQAKDLNFNRKPRVIKKFIAQMQGAALEKSKELFQREAEKEAKLEVLKRSKYSLLKNEKDL